MRLLWIAILIGAGYWSWLNWFKPVPTALDLPDGYQMVELEPYRNEFRILARQDYHYDDGAKFSPVDFAVGMGVMTDPRIYKQFNIEQRNRWYYWRVDDYPIPHREIEINSANMHIVPANPTIAAQLKQVKPDDLVVLSGALIEISHSNGWRWRSSLSREDTGDGACELMRVDQIEWLSP